MVALSFAIHVVVLGFIYSFSVLFNPIQDSFSASKGAVASIGALTNAVMTLFGLVAGRAIDALGFRSVGFLGALLGAVSLLAASASPSLLVLIALYGVAFGGCLGAMYFPSIVSVQSWFVSRRALALGIAVTGSGVGNLVFAPLLSALEGRYGWRVTLRIMASSLAIVALASLGLKRRIPPIKVRSSLALSVLLRDWVFLYLLATSIALSYAILTLFIHIVPSAEENAGASSSQAALVLGSMGAASIAGRLFNGFLGDSLGISLMLRVSAGGMAVALVVWPFITSLAMFFVVGMWYAFFAGSYIGLAPAFVANLYDPKKVPVITGYTIGVSALGIGIGAPLTGVMRDETGSYHLGAFVAAFFSLLSILFITLTVRSHARKLQASDPDGNDPDAAADHPNVVEHTADDVLPSDLDRPGTHHVFPVPAPAPSSKSGSEPPTTNVPSPIPSPLPSSRPRSHPRSHPRSTRSHHRHNSSSSTISLYTYTYDSSYTDTDADTP